MNTAAILEALIPLVGGLFATLLGYNFIKPRNLNPKTAPIIAQLRWLGPLVMAFGAWMLWQGLADKPSRAEEIVREMRQKVTLPLAVDEMTRLDRFDADGRRIIYRMTVTKPPDSEAERDALIAAMPKLLKPQICGDESRRKLLRDKIDLEFVYTIGQKQYPGIVVTRTDCES